VTNTGNVTLTDIVVNDPLTGFNTVIASLAPGMSQAFNTNYIITQEDLDRGFVLNVATATGNDPNDDPIEDEDDEEIEADQMPLLGVAKQVSSGPINNLDGTYDLSYTVVVENMGNVTLSNLQITDDLASTFAAASGFQVNSVTSATLTINGVFNGDSDINLLQGSDELSVGESASVVINLTVTPGAFLGPYLNIAVGNADSPLGENVTDDSQDGNDVDPDNDGDPTNNNDPTPVLFDCELVLQNVPDDTTISCDEVDQLIDEVEPSTPGCCEPIQLVKDVVRIDGSCSDSYTLEITWTATDACGQEVTGQQVVTVVDDSKPIFTAIPASLTVECDDIPDAPVVGIDVIATDNCDDQVMILTSEVTTPGNCKDSYLITRTWTATDNCGNTATAQHTVLVEDTTAPILNNVPVDVTIDCEVPVPGINSVTATDNCDTDVTVIFTETVESQGDCAALTITRTWIATDNCGNTTSDEQKITVIDTTPPVISGVPANLTVECDAVPGMPTVTATDNCSDPVDLTYQEVRIDGNCPGNYTLVRTWTAEDACGNSTAQSYTVTVMDTQAPILNGVPSDLTIACDVELPTPANVTVADNCDTDVMVNFTETVESQGDCASLSITRTWIATDNCGNTTSDEQKITVIDTTPPVISGVPADQTVECDAVPEVPSVIAIDNCSDPVSKYVRMAIAPAIIAWCAPGQQRMPAEIVPLSPTQLR
jgi:uncharacterized repeat protein (TIGR01451 family)